MRKTAASGRQLQFDSAVCPEADLVISSAVADRRKTLFATVNDIVGPNASYFFANLWRRTHARCYLLHRSQSLKFQLIELTLVRLLDGRINSGL